MQFARYIALLTAATLVLAQVQAAELEQQQQPRQQSQEQDQQEVFSIPTPEDKVEARPGSLLDALLLPNFTFEPPTAATAEKEVGDDNAAKEHDDQSASGQQQQQQQQQQQPEEHQQQQQQDVDQTPFTTEDKVVDNKNEVEPVDQASEDDDKEDQKPASIKDRVVLPTNVKPLHYDLKLKPDFGTFTFRADIAIELIIAETTKTIKLNTQDLTILSTRLDLDKDSDSNEENAEDQAGTLEPESTIYDAGLQQTTFTFAKKLPKGTHGTLYIKYDGLLNEAMNGFYRSSYKDANGDTQYMGVTQFESTDARRAFPCWDEPSIKSTYSLTLVVPKHLTALSNMPVLSTTDDDEECKSVVFEKSVKMSTYLVAWAVGEFEYIETTTTKLEKPVTVRVYTLPGLSEQGRFALEITPKVLEYFSEVFGTPYPLPKLDHLAVPDFDAGAMENFGMITYRTVALLFDEKTSDIRFKEQVAVTVAHELAHQWFGNLVTMEWWSALWLNEGFATWVGTLAVDHLFPDWGTWSTFVVDDFQRGINLDSLRSSHPIEVPVKDPQEINQIFDAISYSKGASVIRMLSTWLTVDVFLKGIRRYIAKHMYDNASSDDLWDALSEESGIDVRVFMGTWTRVIGVPVLNVQEDEESGVVTVEQHRLLATNDVKKNEDKTLWWVPLGIRPRPESIEDPNQTLKTRSLSFQLKDPQAPYIFNKDFSGVFRTNYPTSAIHRIGQAILDESDLVGLNDRAGLVADISSLSKSGHGPTTNFLNLVKYYKNEETFVVWDLLANRLGEIGSIFATNEVIRSGIKIFQRNLVDRMVTKLGWEFPANEEFLMTRLRNVVLRLAGRAGHPETVQEAQRRFKIFAQGPDHYEILHPSIRQTAFEIVLSNGGETEFRQVLEYFYGTHKQDQQVVALAALGWVQAPELIAEVQALAISKHVRPQDITSVLAGLSANPVARLSTWEWVKNNWNTLAKRYESSMSILGAVVKYALAQSSNPDLIKDAQEFFKDKETKVFQRALDQALEALAVNHAWVARETDALIDWLKDQPAATVISIVDAAGDDEATSN